MSFYSGLYEFLKKCPSLANLWSIGATEEIGVNVILPQGASPAAQYEERRDIYGNYECEIIPYESLYRDFQINCYRIYDSADSSAPAQNINVLTLDEVQGICDWIAAQNEKEILPEIEGERVIAVECNPVVPQIRYVNKLENTIAYFITVRVRYVNRAERRTVTREAVG